MSNLQLISESNRQIKPVVEAALGNELRLMEAGIKKTRQNLQKLEEKYEMNTRKFVSQYEKDMLEENLDFMEWIGEFKMLERLEEKANTLKGIKIAN